jgi:8-amino-7-oxononanoate synthase
MRIDDQLGDLEQAGLLRQLESRPACGGKYRHNGRVVLNFSSNDYLDLAGDSRLKAAALEAVEQWGCGATASRLMAGNLDLHEALEQALAGLAGGEAALLFGSGFLANLGVLTTLTGRDDEIFSDRLNHASLIDGARLSRAAVHRYRHLDLDHLEQLLRRKAAPGRRLIISDSVFSMDGDQAPVADLARLARTYGAALVVDDAHAFGVLGPQGGGLCRSLEGDLRPDVVVGTMSKALGGYGGFAICSPELRSLLINRARSFIYTTGLPPACLGSARAAVGIIRSEPDLGSRLLARVRHFRKLLVAEGLTVPVLPSAILPIELGDNKLALDVAGKLGFEGLVVTAVRPPTVPPGTARLRLSVTLAHTTDDLRAAASIIGRVVREAVVTLGQQETVVC